MESGAATSDWYKIERFPSVEGAGEVIFARMVSVGMAMKVSPDFSATVFHSAGWHERSRKIET